MKKNYQIRDRETALHDRVYIDSYSCSGTVTKEDTPSEQSDGVEGDVTISPLSSETEQEIFTSLGYSMYLPIGLYGLQLI